VQGDSSLPVQYATVHRLLALSRASRNGHASFHAMAGQVS